MTGNVAAAPHLLDHSTIITAEVRRVAATYPAEAALTPAADRERFFTHVQQAAWDLRFGRDVDRRP